jgi:diguanylate cyclase (GGDEF)-like protein
MLNAGEALALIELDLDHFKNVNDTLGHIVGDQAIRLCCEITKKVVGSAGEVYRRGGDEVIAIAPGLEVRRAVELGEALRSQIQTTFEGWATERQLAPSPTASIGVVVDSSRRPIAEIMQLLDQAQHRAKQGGRNRVEVIDLAPGEEK